MKTPAYLCDCCGYAVLGEPFAYDVCVTTWHYRNRLDHVYGQICEDCATLIGKCAEFALRKIADQMEPPPEYMQ